MTFQGDVAQIPISNIVQALFLNGQEGVLTVDSDTAQRKFLVLKLGIRPLMSSQDDLSLLRNSLVKERILTEAQFDNELSTWDSSQLFPGDFLLQRHVLTPEQVEHCVRKQIEESIYDVLTARDLRYEFSAGEHCVDHEIFDPEGLGTTMIYGVNGVLIEAARREDEWRRIEEEVPSGYEIHIPTEKGLPSNVPADIELPSVVYKEMTRALSGDRSVERIVAESALSRYEIYHALFQLKTRGYIRRLGLAEKEILADKLRSFMKYREAIDVYRSILDDDPGNVRIRIQLIFLLEKGDKHPDLLVEHYLALVRQFEASEPEKARSYVEKILALDPNSFVALEKLVVIHALAGNHPEALAANRALLEAITRTERYREGAEIQMRSLQYFPEETALYHELADLLLASNQNDLAVDCLKSVADIYEQARDTQRQLKTYELIVRIDPSENATLKRLASGSKQAEPRTRSLLRFSAATAAASVLLVALAYWGFVEIDSRRVYAESEKSARTQLRYFRFDRARSVLRDFLSGCRYSTRKKLANELFLQIDSEEKSYRSKLEKARKELVSILGTTLRRSERLITLGNHVDARKSLTGGIAAAAASERQMDGDLARKYERMTALLEQVEVYLGGVERLVSQIAQARKVDDLERAHALCLELLQSYPQSKEADNLRINVLVESTPAGATLLFGQKSFGTTPVVVELPPRRSITGALERPGFRRTSIQIHPTLQHRAHFSLQKLPVWTFPSGGPVDSVPTAAGDFLLFGNRDGRLFCIDRDGHKKWSELEVPLDISGGVALWNNIVCFGAFDGNVYLLDAGTGTPRCAPIKATAGGDAIKEAPSAPSSKGVAVVKCGNRFLVGIDLMENEKKWELAVPDSLQGPPQLDGDNVYCFTEQGHLLELDLHTGRPAGELKRRLVFESSLTHAGRVRNGVVYLGFAGGEVKAFDIKTQKLLWSENLGSAPTAPATVAENPAVVVFPLTSEEVVCLDAATGKLRWRKKTSAEVSRLSPTLKKVQVGSISTDGAVSDRRYCVGSRHGYILCWRLEDGYLEWVFRTAGATQAPRKGIASRGLLHQGFFFQGSDDGNVYCFSVDEN